jgi:hypothetical protein
VVMTQFQSISGDVPLDVENPEAGVAGLESTQPLPFGQDAGSLNVGSTRYVRFR